MQNQLRTLPRERAECGVKRAVALQSFPVDLNPLVDRLDPRARLDGRGDGRVDVRPGARRRRRREAQRRTLRPRRPRRARAAVRAPRRQSSATARCALRLPIRDRDTGWPPSSQTRSSESRRPNATPSSTARTSAPRSWRSSSPTNAPRASGSACGVRSPARYGRKVSPSVPAGQASALGQQLVVRYARRDRVAQPAQRAGCREHHAHHVPSAGDRVAERVDAARTVGGVPLQGGEHDTRGAEHDRQRPRSVDADTECARGLVAAARGHWDVAGRVPGDRRALEDLRQPGRVERQRIEHLIAPAPLRHIEQQRPGGVGDIGDVGASQPEANDSPWAARSARSWHMCRARCRGATAASAP